MMIVSSNTKKIKNKNKKNKHKHNKKNSNDKNKNNKNNKNIKLTKKKQQLEHKIGKEKDSNKHNSTNDIGNTTKLSGGSSNSNKEGFEVKRLTDIDYDQFKLSKYLVANIDWGNCPGTPPTDCCIM